MKTSRLALVFLFSLTLFGCSTLQPIAPADFSDGVVASSSDDNVSWWYLGETDAYYIVAKKSPEKMASFRVDKSQVRITGFDPFRPWMKEPVRLKKENIRFEK